jgi:hypothetical protein
LNNVIDSPALILLLNIIVLSLSAWMGASVLRGRRELDREAREDFGLVLAAALTLLGLIIGFTFSMAISRYDLRKNYEEAEANAIGTEYLRAELLPAADAATTRGLLRRYTDQRVLFYELRDPRDLPRIKMQTEQLQTQLWSAVKVPGAAQPSTVTALALSGMNDVINSEGYTQAAWWNRIPAAGWVLMSVIAVLCNAMIGYAAGKPKSRGILLLVLPFVVSIAFFLIADIDSPRGGIIRVDPQNLLRLAESLR